MLSKLPQRYLLLAVKTERISVRLAEIIAFCRKVGKELLLSVAHGCFCGAGVGFFVFLHLGFPKDLEFTGYISGLFVVAGLKFGFSLWAIRSLVVPLVSYLRDSHSPSLKP